MNLTREAILEQLKEILKEEADAIYDILDHVDDAYLHAVEMIHGCKGKVVVTGMGKSGLIARKIAATMSSTGTLAIFLHPAEGMHGDLGMVAPEDIIIAIGKSGESDELTGILPALKKIGTKIVAITGNPQSTLAVNADIVLYGGVEREACPLNLAPTSSTTVALAIGDALAITLMKLKNFQPEDFAIYHPGGRLGKRLLLKVSDILIPSEKCPVLNPDTARMEEVIIGLSYGLGIVLFSRDGHTLAGIMTDGDVRRILQKYQSEIFKLDVQSIMTKNPTTIQKEWMAVDALSLMEKRDRPLNVVPVLDGEQFAGILRLHELLRVS
jgi:arabinose-5-phosphate isomerase